MAAIPNTIGLTGAIAPIDSNDTYFTHYAQYGLGGFYAVADTTERDAIPAGRLVDGLLVKVLADNKYYVYDSNSWVEESFGNLTYEVKATNFTAAPNRIYGVDTTSGVVTVTLATATKGAVVYFTDARYNFGTNKLVLNGSGVTVLGQASIDLDRDRDCIALVFDDVAGDWIAWGIESSGVAAVSSGSSLTYQVKSTSFTAVKDYLYAVDTTLGIVTVTLNAGTSGDMVHFSDLASNFGTNKLSLVGSGVTVAGGASLDLSNNNECVSLVYDADTTNWLIWGTESSGVTGGGGNGSSVEPYRIINGTSEAGFYNSGGIFEATVTGMPYARWDLGNAPGSTGSISIGEDALLAPAALSYNVAIGTECLKNTTSARYNIAVGNYALASNTTGEDNNAIGDSALYSNTTGSKNVAQSWALAANTEGSNNVGLGYTALHNNTTGNSNIAVGFQSLYTNSTGQENIALGIDALYSNVIGIKNIALGAESLKVSLDSYNVAIGTRSMFALVSGESNTAIGSYTMTRLTSGNKNIAIGISAGSMLSGNSNIAIGAGSLYSNNGGQSNIAIGETSLTFNTTGVFNVALGSNTLDDNTTGSYNIAVGYLAGNGATGSNSVFIGHQAGSLTSSTGSNNICFGYLAIPSSTSVSNEITLGNSSITTLRCQVTSITSLSDRRDKTNIVTLPLGLDFIKTLNPVKFDWNMRDGAKVGITDYGFIAQDLQEAQAGNEWLDLVLDNNPDRLEATPGKLIPVLVKAIQELSATVTNLNTRLTLLEHSNA